MAASGGGAGGAGGAAAFPEGLGGGGGGTASATLEKPSTMATKASGAKKRVMLDVALALCMFISDSFSYEPT